MLAVVVVGSLSLDTVLTNSKTIRKLGGVVTYGGLTFARLGIQTSAVTNVAQCDRAVCRVLEAEGIRLFTGETASTTRFVNDIRGETRLQTAPATAEPIHAAHIRLALDAGATHLHLGPLHWRDIDETFLAELDDLRPLRPTISADIQGLLRRVEHGTLTEEVSPLLDPVMRSAAHVHASRDEVVRISSYFGLTAPEMVQEMGLREMVITEGVAGGVVVDAAGRETRYQAGANEREHLDTTGAGDVFFAAYLAYRLGQGERATSAAERAAKLAFQHVHGRFITEESLSLDRHPPMAEESR
jgi:sugar/nucleoside kinase (ribokinase family)